MLQRWSGSVLRAALSPPQNQTCAKALKNSQQPWFWPQRQGFWGLLLPQFKTLIVMLRKVTKFNQLLIPYACWSFDLIYVWALTIPLFAFLADVFIGYQRISCQCKTDINCQFIPWLQFYYVSLAVHVNIKQSPFSEAILRATCLTSSYPATGFWRQARWFDEELWTIFL